MVAVKQLPITPLRLPPDLKIWLKHQATNNRRSLNAEIIVRLEESRQKEEHGGK